NELRPAGFDGRQRFVGVARRARLVALVLQDAADKLANVVFVVDDQNVCSHQRVPVFSSRGSAASPEAPASGSFISTIAPRPPSARVSPSSRSTPPPWSSKILTTIGSPSPVPSARVVT